MKKIIVILVLSLILITGCDSIDWGGSLKPKCNKPYILVGRDCCLDQNDNSICDIDEAIGTTTTIPSVTTTTNAQITSSTTTTIPTTTTTLQGRPCVTAIDCVLPGAKCENNVCIFSACISDADCEWDEYCDNGMCFFDSTKSDEFSAVSDVIFMETVTALENLGPTEETLSIPPAIDVYIGGSETFIISFGNDGSVPGDKEFSLKIIPKEEIANVFVKITVLGQKSLIIPTNKKTSYQVIAEVHSGAINNPLPAAFDVVVNYGDSLNYAVGSFAILPYYVGP